MGTRRPNQRSSIYLGKDGFWHGWVTIGVRADGSPDRRHRMGKTEAEIDAKQGRIPLPKHLLDYAGITREIVAVRAGRYWRLSAK